MNNKVITSVGKVIIKRKVSSNYKLVPAEDLKSLYGDFTKYINRKNNKKSNYKRRG